MKIGKATVPRSAICTADDETIVVRGEVLAASSSQGGRLIRVLPGFSLRPMSVVIIAPPGRLRIPRVRAVADVITRALRRSTARTRAKSSRGLKGLAR